MKKVISILLTAIFAFSLFSVCAFAEESDTEKTEENEEAKVESSYKAEEVIYGILKADGKIEKVLPVVALDAKEKTELNYYGDFTEIRNLTDTKEIDVNGSKVELEIPEGRFYFEGELENPEIPWLVDISYKLNGKKIDSEELGGKDGRLEINISVKANEKADRSFFDAYMMQISATLSSDKCKNIAAEGATIANAGANKMINFMSMPGSESDFVITADVNDFSMGGMSIAAVPVSMADMLNSMGGISEGIDEFSDAMTQLSSGVSQLNNGAFALSEGMNQFSTGLLELSANSQPIRDAAEMMLNGLKSVDSVLGAIGNGDISQGEIDLGIVPEALRNMAASVTATAESINAEQNNITAAVDNMNAAFAADRTGIDETGLVYISALESAWNASAGILNTAVSNLETVEQDIRNNAAIISGTADTLEELANVGGAGTANIGQYISGLEELIEHFEMFYDGIIKYTQGVDMLADNSVSLAEGVTGIAGGTYQLNSGTSQIPGKMDQMIDSVTGDEFEAHSFLDEKNENVVSVQFVFSTEGIDAPDEAPEETENEETQSGAALFFSRLKGLFSKEEN